jgi:hypothetical protein
VRVAEYSGTFERYSSRKVNKKMRKQWRMIYIRSESTRNIGLLIKRVPAAASECDKHLPPVKQSDALQFIKLLSRLMTPLSLY